VPKIVIKPRNPAAVATSSRPSPTSEMVSPQEEDDIEQDVDEGQAMDVDQDHASQTEDNPQTGDEDLPGSVNVASGRPRGRPRGRGRGALPGTSTPRARGKRGRGRGRGRGAASSLLIRLPKRGDDDADVDGDADIEGGDADADEGGGTPLDGDVVELPVEKEVPMGGGKPFRKIHGQAYIIDGDEFVTEDNPIGDEKIDQFGNLLGGASVSLFSFEYRVFLK
jgi:chromatin structure-remodeling complex protein RSC7